MKKNVFIVLLLISNCVFAQTKKDWSKVNISKAGDHIMLQLSSDHWTGMPDSISSHQKGLSRGLNIYAMINKPFKTDPRWSVAFGVGVGSSNITFKKMSVDITKIPGSILPFTNLDSSNHFKKYKLATAFLEIPVELRYTFNPEHENKSWKIAGGVKVGTMLNVHTKGKTLQDKNGAVVNAYTEKETKKTFFNTSRFMATARVGYGHYSLFGSYQITSVLKDVSGPSMHLYQVGFTLSGL